MRAKKRSIRFAVWAEMAIIAALAKTIGARRNHGLRAGGLDRATLIKHIDGIYDNLMEIFERARADKKPTGEVADTIAEERFRR